MQAKTSLLRPLVAIKLVLFTPLLVAACSAGNNISGSPKGNDELALARAAAKAFCGTFNFPADKIGQLDGPPLFEPVSLERDSRPVIAYRWLGGGRGDYYVQVEIYQDNGQAIVYGGYSHQEFGPWTFEGRTMDIDNGQE